MTRIWKETGFVADDAWGAEIPETEEERAAGPIYDLRTFLELSESLMESGKPLAVVLEPADDTAKLEPHLSRLSMIAVKFPAFSDGRAFSHAALLRTRYGYAGEIRAVGDVLIDQIPLMLRCGIDSFAVSDPVALKRLDDGRLTGIPLHYQPSARPAASAPAYAWRRSSRPAA